MLASYQTNQHPFGQVLRLLVIRAVGAHYEMG